MTADGDGYKVGYRRPPKRSRWKKGQSGNPRGRRRHTHIPLYKIIETALAEKVSSRESGKRRRRTVFEVILLRLWLKAGEGDARAFRILSKYMAFAKTRPVFRKIMEPSLEALTDHYTKLLREPVERSPELAGLSLLELTAHYEQMLRESDVERDW